MEESRIHSILRLANLRLAELGADLKELYLELERSHELLNRAAIQSTPALRLEIEKFIKTGR